MDNIQEISENSNLDPNLDPNLELNVDPNVGPTIETPVPPQSQPQNLGQSQPQNLGQSQLQGPPQGPPQNSSQNQPQSPSQSPSQSQPQSQPQSQLQNLGSQLLNMPTNIAFDPNTVVSPEIQMEILNDEEEFYEDWIKKLSSKARFCEKCAMIFKLLHSLILIPSMILSFIFGSSGLTSSSTMNSNIQSIFLIISGILTAIIKFTKLEKKAAKFKIKYENYDSLLQVVEKQKIFCKRPDICQKFDEFFVSVQKEYNRIENI